MIKLKQLAISPLKGSQAIKQLFSRKEQLIPCTEIKLDFEKYKRKQMSVDRDMASQMKKWKQV